MVQEVLQSRQQPWRWVQWPAIRSWWRQLRGSSKLILLTTTWEVASFGIWSKVAKWKSSIRGAFMSWPQIKKSYFEVSFSLILCNDDKSFFDQIGKCIEKCILYDNRRWPAQWLHQAKTPKHSPKPNLHQKKVMVTVWWSAAGLIHYSFLNPIETI